MERFVKRYADRIVGSIAGFDRILFRGNLSSICHVGGMDRFLSSQRVLYKDFSVFVQRFSKRVKERAEQIAKESGRPIIHLSSPKESKEDFVREIIERDQITAGLICVLTCVEPCASFSIRGDRASKRLKLVAETRQCQHLYFYFLDDEFGLLHVRLQTWLPLTIQVCINGREYLARQLLRESISFTQADNCFTAIGDLERAQQLSDQLVTRKWKPFLDALARRVNPWLERKSEIRLHSYYWTIRQGEYATDILFRDPQALADIYPALVEHTIKNFHTEDVLRFLGRKTRSISSGEVKSSLQRRFEGVRIKHWLHENSIKMYDKQGSVLRIETTINKPKRFQVRRRRKNKQGSFDWLPLRKGIADIRRRVQLSRAANERYLQALAVVGEPTPSYKLLDQVSKPTVQGQQKFRALRPVSPEDSALFEVLLDGKFAIQGIRNKDIRQQLWPTPQDKQQERKMAARVTRSLTLLKSHNLIHRVPRTNYYRTTKLGDEVMNTALNFRHSNISLLAA